MPRNLCGFAESFLGRNANCVNGGDFCCCDVLRMMGIRGAGKQLRVFLCQKIYALFYDVNGFSWVSEKNTWLVVKNTSHVF